MRKNVRSIPLIISIVLLIGVGLFVGQRFLGDRYELPTGGETHKETITLRDGEVVNEEIMNQQEKSENTKNGGQEKSIALETKEITVTDGVKHSVPLDEIIGGGPPKDGIPSIDNPKFISPKEASDWLGDDEPGLAFSRGGINRFYPYQILVWHEIVNDTVGGERILVSYCPLCLTGFVFDPVVGGERVEFGTSGKLWKSNLVMYDRKTDSLWSQILGEAIVGPMTGTELKHLSSDQVLYGNWKKKFPEGEVLSRDTGTTRLYGSNPYGGYFNATSFAVNMAGFSDERLPRDAFVFGITAGDKAKAYHTEAIKKAGEVIDEFGGKTLVLTYDTELDVVRMFERESDGTLTRINPVSGFWFSWVATHPDTELYK